MVCVTQNLSPVACSFYFSLFLNPVPHLWIVILLFLYKGRSCDEGKSFLNEVPDSPAAAVYRAIVQSKIKRTHPFPASWFLFCTGHTRTCFLKFRVELRHVGEAALSPWEERCFSVTLFLLKTFCIFIYFILTKIEEWQMMTKGTNRIDFRLKQKHKRLCNCSQVNVLYRPATFGKSNVIFGEYF